MQPVDADARTGLRRGAGAVPARERTARVCYGGGVIAMGVL
jgi:hypothetical protein